MIMEDKQLAKLGVLLLINSKVEIILKISWPKII